MKRIFVFTRAALVVMAVTFGSARSQTPQNIQPIAIPNPNWPTYEQLPWCNFQENAIDTTNLPSPSEEDLSRPPSCRIRTNIIDVSAATNDQLPFVSVPRSSYVQNRLPFLSYPRSSYMKTLSQEKLSGQMSFAWAVNTFSCEYPANTCSASSPGFNLLYANFTAQVPTLISGSWNDYHYYNRFHFYHPSYQQTCFGWPNTETVSAGIAKGSFEASSGNLVTFDNEVIYEEFVKDSSGNNVCNIHGTGLTFSPPGALMFRVYRQGSAWNIDVWLGYWSRIATTWTGWSVAAGAEIGQEVASTVGNLNAITIQVSFAHRINVAGTSNSYRPWSDTVLISPLNGRSYGVADAPFYVLDFLGGDFTAIASSLNIR